MPKIVITSRDDLAPERVQELWREACEKSSPVEELVELAKELQGFERTYGMTSEEFERRFEAGELGDAFDYFDWLATYHLFLETKAYVEKALMRAAVQREAEEAQMMAA